MEPHTSVSIGEKQILDTYSKKKSGQQEHVYIYMYIICSALRWFEAYAAKPITAHSKISLYKISSLYIDIRRVIPFIRRQNKYYKKGFWASGLYRATIPLVYIDI